MNTELPFNLNKKIVSIAGFVFILAIIPVVVLLSQQQQNYRQSAHTPQPSVSVSCNGGETILTSSYILTNIPQGVTAVVTATDSQQYLNDSFTFKNGDPPHTKTVNTHKSSITDGIVTFKTVASDGFQQTNDVVYHQNAPCTPQPTPTPSVPACSANQAVCKWDTNPNAANYIYIITEKNSNTVIAQGSVNAPQTSVSFPSTAGKSYICAVTPVSQCGTGTTGKGEFNCIVPTPSTCVVPNQPANVRIICPDCSNTNGGGVVPLWIVAISANASCPTSSALITYSFTNNDPSFGPMNVIVKDNQTGKSVNLGSVSPGQTKTGQIDTGLTVLNSGTVSFNLSGKGSSDTKTIPYKAVQCSVPSPTSIPTPSACPSVGTVNNVSITCIHCQ